MLDDKLQLSYALAGAKDNPVIESFNSRFKAEGHSLFLEAGTVAELSQVVNERMAYYNQQRRHSSIGYQAPLAYIRQVRNETDW